MKFLGVKQGVYVYAPRKNEPTDGNILDKITDDLNGVDFNYVGIKSPQDARINGFQDIMDLVIGKVDFDKYNLIFVKLKEC